VGHVGFWFMLTMLVYLAKKLHTLSKNTEILLVASKDGGLEVSTDTNRTKRLDCMNDCCHLEDPSR
jgi:hypothetical protein